MKRRVFGTVESITSERPGAQELLVRVLFESLPSGEEATLRQAINLLDLMQPVQVGDPVILNTVAVELGLGTGGLDFVVAVVQTDAGWAAPGHIIKLRYTPLQIPVLAVEAPESPHHNALAGFETLDDMPVVCVELHSQLPGVCAAAHWALKDCKFPRSPRIVYIMTDGASLPLALSRTVAELKASGLLVATITAGQAFGGDYEAVNIYSALAAAKEVLDADIVVMGQGPGNVGTDTPLGFSGIDQGLAINAAGALGGVPIAVTRISFADERERHHGLSHHTITVLLRIANTSALVPIPRLPVEMLAPIYNALEDTGIAEKHQPVIVDAGRGIEALEESGLHVMTMGRSLPEERPFFLATAAAGMLAAQLVEAREYKP